MQERMADEVIFCFILSLVPFSSFSLSLFLFPSLFRSVKENKQQSEAVVRSIQERTHS